MSPPGRAERPPPSVEEFLATVTTQEFGWSDTFGGPAGVVRAVDELQTRIKAQQEQLRAVRGAAFQRMLDEHRSLSDVAREFGIGGQAVWKATRYDTGQVQTW